METNRPGNGGASIREVYELVERMRREILDALETATERVGSDQVRLHLEVRELEARFSAHAELEGHPKTVEEVRSLRLYVAKAAGVAAAVVSIVVFVAQIVAPRLIGGSP